MQEALSNKALNRRQKVSFGKIILENDFLAHVEARFMARYLSGVLHGGMSAELHGIIHEAAEKIDQRIENMDIHGVGDVLENCWFALMENGDGHRVMVQVNRAPAGLADAHADATTRIRMRCAIARTVNAPYTLIAAMPYSEWARDYAERRAKRIEQRSGHHC